MSDKEKNDMQTHKSIKDRPRAIHYSHQSKHFGHGFAHNSSHKYGKENNKQSAKHHKEEVKLDGEQKRLKLLQQNGVSWVLGSLW